MMASELLGFRTFAGFWPGSQQYLWSVPKTRFWQVEIGDCVSAKTILWELRWCVCLTTILLHGH